MLVALYGNREFDDALVELRDLSAAKGFNIIAAGAFIGEHSFSTPTQPIAAGRPDADDLKQAIQFGKQVATKIASNHFDTPDIDGHVPYKERPNFGGKATADQWRTMHSLRKMCGSLPHRHHRH